MYQKGTINPLVMLNLLESLIRVASRRKYKATVPDSQRKTFTVYECTISCTLIADFTAVKL